MQWTITISDGSVLPTFAMNTSLDDSSGNFVFTIENQEAWTCPGYLLTETVGFCVVLAEKAGPLMLILWDGRFSDDQEQYHCKGRCEEISVEKSHHADMYRKVLAALTSHGAKDWREIIPGRPLGNATWSAQQTTTGHLKIRVGQRAAG